jgi:hypothetical protein
MKALPQVLVSVRASAGRFSPSWPPGIILLSPFNFSVPQLASGDEEWYLIGVINRILPLCII